MNLIGVLPTTKKDVFSLFSNKTVSGILLIAGNSSRFKSNLNKNLERINNKPIFMYSLEIFNNCEYIDDIFIVVKDSELNIVKSILNNFVAKKKITLVTGGNTRQESVLNAIMLSNFDIVVIHDGARPNLKQDYIENSLLELNLFSGTSIAVKSKDTIKVTDDNGIVIESTTRENTWVIQTPQCFDRKLLVEAHLKQRAHANITDDCMLLENMGHKVKLVLGDYSNIKITTKEDVKIMKELLKEQL